MTQAVATYEQYEADFRKLQVAHSSDADWLKELRNAAFAHFQEIGFPVARKGNEQWKYTDVRPIAADTFPYDTSVPSGVDAAKLFPFDDGMARLAFVDGRFSPELSTPPLMAMTETGTPSQASAQVTWVSARFSPPDG